MDKPGCNLKVFIIPALRVPFDAIIISYLKLQFKKLYRLACFIFCWLVNLMLHFYHYRLSMWLHSYSIYGRLSICNPSPGSTSGRRLWWWWYIYLCSHCFTPTTVGHLCDSNYYLHWVSLEVLSHIYTQFQLYFVSSNQTLAISLSIIFTRSNPWTPATKIVIPYSF